MSFKKYHEFLFESTANLAIPQSVLNEAAKKKKTKQLEDFVNNLPTSAKPNGQELLKKLDEKKEWREEFISKLWTMDMSQLESKGIASSEYSKSGSVGEYIFELVPKGMGMGEIFLSWLISGSAANGGGGSFDLTVGGAKYEVKDYRGESVGKQYPENKPIRVGIGGSPGNFAFWDQIKKTIDLVKNLQSDIETQEPKRPLKDMFDNQDFIDSLTYIESRLTAIPEGKFGRNDYKNFKLFYESISKVKYVSNVYTAVELRGADVKPVEVSINPVSPEDVKKGTFSITISNSPDADADYVLTNLRRIKYARKPEDFDIDLKDAAVKIASHARFIIFRPSGVKMPPAKDWNFYSVDSGKIKILESGQTMSDED
jgi:hypothetical protein